MLAERGCRLTVVPATTGAGLAVSTTLGDLLTEDEVAEVERAMVPPQRPRPGDAAGAHHQHGAATRWTPPPGSQKADTPSLPLPFQHFP